jgi:hypothetical protein
VLEIWKGHSLPQPAIFWTREVWNRCGQLSETAYWLDYDLFCRLSQDYVFHPIDQVLANYRLHPESKTSSATEQERLEASIGVSRRYWSSLSLLDSWKLHWSYARFRFNRRQRARDLLVRSRNLWRQSARVRALPLAIAGTMLGPDLVTDVVVMPVLKPRLWRVLARGREMPRLWKRADHPQTSAWRDFVALHADGWAGPTLVQEVEIDGHHTVLEVAGTVFVGWLGRPLQLEVSIGGKSLGRQSAGAAEQFVQRWSLAGIPPGRQELRIVSSEYAVPHHALGNQDFRPLSFRLDRLRVE